MSIGIIVDGNAEALAMVPLIDKLRGLGCSLRNPIYADIQPRSTPKQIVQSALQKLKILQRRGANKIVVLIDLEDKGRCAAKFSTELQDAFIQMGWAQVLVVVKDVAFENWLISDPDALKQLSARFSVTDKYRKTVSDNKADSVEEPVKLLNAICKGKRAYHKRDDARAIADKLDPLNMARNSRSFRRFLRVVEHPGYLNQSKDPI